MRLQVPIRLINNLRAENEMERAAQAGYDFPTDRRETLECEFEAIAQQGMEEEDEEEELIYEWNKEFGGGRIRSGIRFWHLFEQYCRCSSFLPLAVKA